MAPGLSHHLTVTILVIPRDNCCVTLAHLQLCGITVRWLLFNFEISHLAAIGNCFCCLVTKLCLTLCNLMDFSTPGFPVLHYLPEFTQTHVHWVSDAVQPSHPLSSPSPSAFNLSQHQGLSQWVSSLHHMAKVLELQLQHQSFQWIFRADFL